MGQAFYAQLPILEKMVLLVLCDHSNDVGEHVFAGLQVLSVKAGASERTIQRALKSLEVMGLIAPTGGGGRGIQKRVRISLHRLREEAIKGDKLARFSVEKGDSGDQKRVTDSTPQAPVSSFRESTVSKDLEPKTLTTLSGKPDHARDILEFLNRKTGRHYQPVEANLKLIRARLREATADQIRAVIVVKWREWNGDPKWEGYLQPSTLFNAQKFASYIGKLPASAFQAEAL